ncbi:helix-turn-helix transcriptional regulator (plasmid) [Legionella sp. D16C41]|uniref:helix-turn-helix transcriptional regulator n=1 Tax=Legionella sp. D16C41 TaxID=3402688 RepID=UPI003AF7625D
MSETSVLAKNLEQLLAKHHIKALNLAKEINIPQPTLHHILSGTTKKPRNEILKKLANFFNISASSLFDARVYEHDSLNLKKFPLSLWNENLHQFETSYSERYIIGNYPSKSFVFTINNAYCQSSWPNQSLAIIKKQDLPEEGRISLVWIKEYGLILGKVNYCGDSIEIEYQNINKALTSLLKFDLKEGKWFGKLIEIRLEGQEAIDSYLFLGL